MAHDAESPLAGTTVELIHRDTFRGGLVSFLVDDWFDRVRGSSWKDGRDTLTFDYAGRRQFHNLPDDDDVLLGKLEDGSEKLIHVSEIEGFK